MKKHKKVEERKSQEKIKSRRDEEGGGVGGEVGRNMEKRSDTKKIRGIDKRR